MQYNILIQGKDFSDCPIAQALVKIPYWVTQKLPQIYTANHATFPIREITVQICGNFLVTQYLSWI